MTIQLKQTLCFDSITSIDVSADFSRVDSSGNTVTKAEKEGLLLYNGQKLCDDYFDDNTANAICRLLGYSGYFNWITEYDRWDIQYSYKRETGDVRCSNGDWSSCTYTTDTSCRNDDIFLACSGELNLFNLIVILLLYF